MTVNVVIENYIELRNDGYWFETFEGLRDGCVRPSPLLQPHQVSSGVVQHLSVEFERRTAPQPGQLPVAGSIKIQRPTASQVRVLVT